MSSNINPFVMKLQYWNIRYCRYYFLIIKTRELLAAYFCISSFCYVKNHVLKNVYNDEISHERVRWIFSPFEGISLPQRSIQFFEWASRQCIIDYFMALLVWILTLSRRLFSGPSCEGHQQGSADGFEPGLPAVTGLREQDAHSASFQQAIRHMRPAGLEDHGRWCDLFSSKGAEQSPAERAQKRAREIYLSRLSRVIFCRDKCTRAFLGERLTRDSLRDEIVSRNLLLHEYKVRY